MKKTVQTFIPYSIGVILINEEAESLDDIFLFDSIIKSGMTAPISRSRIYEPAFKEQRQIHFELFQGSPNPWQKPIKLGDITLKYTPAINNGDKFRLKLNYDEAGTLTAELKHLSSHSRSKQKIAIAHPAVLPNAPPANTLSIKQLDNYYQPTLKHLDA